MSITKTLASAALVGLFSAGVMTVGTIASAEKASAGEHATEKSGCNGKAEKSGCNGKAEKSGCNGKAEKNSCTGKSSCKTDKE